MDLPPLDWLMDVSLQSLADLELACLDRGSRHTKAAKAEWNAALKELTTAELARYLRDHREEILEIARRTIDQQSLISFPDRKRA